MDSRRRRGLALALLATLAVALVASAAAPLFAAGQAGEPPSSADRGPDRSDAGASGIPGDPTLVVVAVLVVTAVGVLVQFVREPGETFVLAVKLGAAGAVAVAVLSYLYRNFSIDYFVAEGGSREPAPTNLSITDTPTPGAADPGTGPGGPGALPTEDVALVALVVVAVGTATVLAWRSTAVRETLGLGRDRPDPESEDGVDRIGRVASEAADQVDDAATPGAADDAVYGAWRDMVSLLDLGDPRSETPREFARAATDAGMDPDDVSVLTRAFEEVRYGDAALSDERQSRVAAALRRIEAAQADGGTDDPADASGAGGTVGAADTSDADGDDASDADGTDGADDAGDGRDGRGDGL
jgi:hypothetical protein